MLTRFPTSPAAMGRKRSAHYKRDWIYFILLCSRAERLVFLGTGVTCHQQVLCFTDPI